jgi:hypothetical protein
MENRSLASGYIFTIYFIAFSIGGYFIVSPFEAVFDSFGGNLPVSTLVLLATYKYWGILAIVSLVVLARLHQGKGKGLRRVLSAMAVATGLLVPFTCWAMYSPVFNS